MLELRLSKRFAVLALNAQRCNQNTMSRRVRVRCAAAAALLELLLDGTLEKRGAGYLLQAPAAQPGEAAALVYRCLQGQQGRERPLLGWVRLVGKLPYKDCLRTEAALAAALERQGLLHRADDLLSCDLYLDSSGVAAESYVADGAQYRAEAEVLRAEILEEGAPSDEAVCLLWLVEECGMRTTLFSMGEQEAVARRRMQLYRQHPLGRDLLGARLGQALARTCARLTDSKRRLCKTPMGTGLAFVFPALNREQSVFIDTEGMFPTPLERLEAVKRRLELHGHQCVVRAGGATPLLEIDNQLFHAIPTAVVCSRVPIHGVRLRRYVV